MTSVEDVGSSGESNFENVLQSLRNAGKQGFHVKAFKICSAEYGVPQRRVRLFFLGYNKLYQKQCALTISSSGCSSSR